MQASRKTTNTGYQKKNKVVIDASYLFDLEIIFQNTRWKEHARLYVHKSKCL